MNKAMKKRRNMFCRYKGKGQFASIEYNAVEWVRTFDQIESKFDEDLAQLRGNEHFESLPQQIQTEYKRLLRESLSMSLCGLIHIPSNIVVSAHTHQFYKNGQFYVINATGNTLLTLNLDLEYIEFDGISQSNLIVYDKKCKKVQFSKLVDGIVFMNRIWKDDKHIAINSIVSDAQTGMSKNKTFKIPCQ